MLGHKACLNKFKKNEITFCSISDCNKIKLDINNKRNHRKISNTWKVKNTLLNDRGVTNEIREEIKKFPKSNENKNTTS
jgi:hypothetical protein